MKGALTGLLLAVALSGCGMRLVADRYYVVNGEEAVRLSRMPITVVVDLRPPADYEAGHAPGALSIPLNQLWVRMDELPSFYDSPILLYDAEPSRLARGCGLLVREGYYKVYCLKDGWRSWLKAGGGLTQEAPPKPW